MPHFDMLKKYISMENIVRKGEIACNKFLTMFSTLYGFIFQFKCTLRCRLQFVSMWTSLKFCNGLITGNI